MEKAVISGSELPYLFIRGKNSTFIYRRIFPKKYIELAGKGEFKQSFKSQNPSEILARYSEIHNHYEALLKRLKAGYSIKEAPPLPALPELKSIAQSLGLPYQSAQQQSQNLDYKDLQKRISKWVELGEPTADDTISAIFGALEDEPTVNDLLVFYEDHTKDQRFGLQKREIDKKLNPVRHAIGRFQAFLKEERTLAKITRKDALLYRSHLVDLVQQEELKATTADKQLMHVRKVITTYLDANGMETANPFAKVGIKGASGKRPAFSIDFIKKKWLKGNAFSGLNEEAKCILFALLDTGCGAKELCGIQADEIHLDHAIPHIEVKANDNRKLKTEHRGRKVVLIGNALVAFKKFPQGFPTYNAPNGPEAFSATTMKYLKAHNLLEKEGHTIYSTRHMFKDRMRNHNFPEELQNYLMGHKNHGIGSQYGSGYSLDKQKQYMDILEKDLY